MKEVRCVNCNRKLAVADFIEIQIKCPRCGALNHQKASEPLDQYANSGCNGGSNVTTHHSLDRRQAQAG